MTSPVPPSTPDDRDPVTSDSPTQELRTCPSCARPTGVGSPCETCGGEPDVAHGRAARPDDPPRRDDPPVSDPDAAQAAPPATPEEPVPAGDPESRPAGMLVLGGPPPAPADPDPSPLAGDGPRCSCGGGFTDGYCDRCGSPLPPPRAHTEDAPAPWVAGVCDIGIRHRSNQDAMALSTDGHRAALVVCDGVSSALRSEDASQAAADAAVAVLARATSTGIGVPSSFVPALVARLGAACDAAADAVAEVTAQVHRELGVEGAHERGPVHTNPSCTFVAAIVEAGHVVLGSVGDSRAYWFPDSGDARRLTVDDSWAEEQITLGATREQAESGPGAHTITRWLGIDCEDHVPRTVDFPVEQPGWLILCSDGLWNYASDPAALAEVVAQVDRGSPASGPPPVEDGPKAQARADALTLARGLVQWANARGGHDNITVIAARLTPDAPTQEA